MEPATEPAPSAAKIACQFSSWYPLFKAHTIESVVVPLPAEFIAYLNADGVVVPNDAFGKHKHTEPDDVEETQWDENEEEITPARFPELESQISAAIASFGLAFPKLNWTAPRDAVWMAVDGSLRCRSPGEVFLLLKSSEILSSDLSAAQSSRVPVALVLRKWTHIDEGAEFRCFVKNKTLRGISQRHHSLFFPYAKQEKVNSETLIERFFTTTVKNKFLLDDYVFDVYIDHQRECVRLLDFAPFGETDSLLFDWDEFATDRNPTDELIRVVEKATHILPSPLAHYRLPRDPIDVSTADAIDNFARQLRSAAEKEKEAEPAKQP